MPPERGTVTGKLHPQLEHFLRQLSLQTIIQLQGLQKIDSTKLTLSHDGKVLIYDSKDPIKDADKVFARLVRDNQDYNGVEYIINKVPMREPGTLVHSELRSFFWIAAAVGPDNRLKRPLPMQMRALRAADSIGAQKLKEMNLEGVSFVSQTGHIAKVNNLETIGNILRIIYPTNNQSEITELSRITSEKKESEKSLEEMMQRVRELEAQAAQLAPTSPLSEQDAAPSVRTFEINPTIGRSLLAGGLAVALPTALVIGSGLLLTASLGIGLLGAALLGIRRLQRFFR
ncbi:hypothetical protein EBR66_04175 [bacterium]|nr:hypothetical protein [bacterium]